MGAVGTQRSWIVVVLLSIVTLGIYGLYWQYAMFKEMKEHSGSGLGGWLGLFLSVITGGLVAVFLLPNEVGQLYRTSGRAEPVTWKTGFWVLLPLVGGLVWLAKTQNRVNEYWAAPAATASSST
jgi:hypothetical protein